jgi:hypothetical protein
MSPKLSILSWEDVACDKRVERIGLALERLIDYDAEVSSQARLNCDYFLRKFCGCGPVQSKTTELQMQYLINETALSIYMNECLRYEYEVYRRGSGFVDFLYEARRDQIREITGGSARRKLLSLELVWKEDQA